VSLRVRVYVLWKPCERRINLLSQSTALSESSLVIYEIVSPVASILVKNAIK
jgi:hypothetical protein